MCPDKVSLEADKLIDNPWKYYEVLTMEPREKPIGSLAELIDREFPLNKLRQKFNFELGVVTKTPHQ